MATALAGCGSKDTNKSCETGSEGCACFPNDTCAAGLSCYSKLCVAIGNGSGGSANAQGGRATDATGGRGEAGDATSGGQNEAGEPNASGGVTTAGGARANTGGTTARGGAPDAGQGGAPDTGQGGTVTAQGGKAQGGAITSTGGAISSTGGAISSTGGAVSSTGGAGNEVSDPHIIDNFSSCNNVISRVAGRDGSWYTFGDNDVNVTPNTQSANPAPAVSSPPSAFSSGACAAWVTGGCATTADACAYAGNGFTFRADSGPYDVSAYAGVQFDYEGDQLWVAVTTSSGYAFGTIIAASPAARRTRSFNFADLTPAAETPQGTPFDLTRIRQIEFTATKPSGFGQAIWDVRFF
jgi:hypothetical protein